MAKEEFSFSLRSFIKMQLLGILFLLVGLTCGSPLLKKGSTRGDEEIYMTTVNQRLATDWNQTTVVFF